MGWLPAVLRRLRDDGASTLGLAALVLATAFVAATGPRLLTLLQDRALQSAFAAADAPSRAVELIQVGRISASPTSASSEVDSDADQLGATLGPSLSSIVGARDWVAETPNLRVTSGSPIESDLTLRIQQAVAGHVRLVAGRFPTAQTTTTSTPPTEAGRRTLTVVEAMMAEPAATELRVGAGDVLTLTPEPTDPLALGGNVLQGDVAVRIVGLYVVPRPSDPYWIDDTTVAGWALRAVNPNFPYVATTVLVSPDAYPSLLGTQMPLIYRFRWYVDPARLHVRDIASLETDLRRLDGTYVATGAPEPGEVTLRTSMLDLLENRFAPPWQATTTVLAMAAVGVAVVVLATLALVATLAAQRDRQMLLVWRARGASTGQIGAAVAVEGLVVALPLALFSGWLAGWILPSGTAAPTWPLPLAVAVVTTLLLLLAAVPAALSAPGSRAGAWAAPGARRSGPRRLVAEALVVGLALAGAVLLRDRGLASSSTAAGLVAADPLLVATPALLGLAAGIVIARLAGVVLRGVAAVAAKARWIAPALGGRRAARGGTAGVLLVLLATAALGGFAAAVAGTLAASSDVEAWQEVGAGYRIDAGGSALPANLLAARLPGVAMHADAYEAPATLSVGGARTLLAIDPAAYTAVTAGSPVDPRLPVKLTGTLAAATTGTGPAAVPPLPALVSAGSPDALTVGQTFSIESVGNGTPIACQVIAVRGTFPGLAPGTPFVVVSRPQLLARVPASTAPVTTRFLRGTDGDLDVPGLRAAIERLSPNATVQTPAQRSSALLGAPAAAAATAGMIALALLAAGYAALAVGAALALAGAARTIEGAYLRALGLSEAQDLGALAVEHGPALLLALGVGSALGVGFFVFVESGLHLASIVGVPSETLAVTPGALVPVVAASLLVIAAGIVLNARLAGSAPIARAAREGLW